MDILSLTLQYTFTLFESGFKNKKSSNIVYEDDEIMQSAFMNSGYIGKSYLL